MDRTPADFHVGQRVEVMTRQDGKPIPGVVTSVGGVGPGPLLEVKSPGCIRVRCRNEKKSQTVHASFVRPAEEEQA